MARDEVGRVDGHVVRSASCVYTSCPSHDMVRYAAGIDERFIVGVASSFIATSTSSCEAKGYIWCEEELVCSWEALGCQIVAEVLV